MDAHNFIILLAMFWFKRFFQAYSSEYILVIERRNVDNSKMKVCTLK